MVLVLVQRCIKKIYSAECPVYACTISQIGDLSQFCPSGFETPKLMEYLFFHLFFIVLVVLLRSRLVAHWQPIWLTVPCTCVRSALVTNLHALLVNLLSSCSVYIVE